MKTLTQVVLPIVAVAALVFGITYVLNFSTTAPGPAKNESQAAVTHNALRFVTILGRKDPDAEPERPFLKYWRDGYEIGEEGHFDFWFANPNPQPVRVTFTRPSCQCAGAKLGVVPREAWNDYVRTSAHSGLSSTPAGLIVQALNTAAMAAKIQWKALTVEGNDKDGTVPAATSDGPQMGIVRLSWTGKDPLGAKSISGQVITSVQGSAPNSPITLNAKFMLFTPFEIYSKAVRYQGRAPILEVGEIGPGAVVEHELFIASKTRRQMDLDLEPRAGGASNEFVSWSKPAQLNPDEVASFVEQFPDAGEVASVYRIVIALRERREAEQNGRKVVKQIDLGPLDLNLKLICRPRTAWEEEKTLMVALAGIVRGDVHVVNGESLERIDFGSSFSSAETRSAQVVLMSNRADLDLEVDATACVPDYLQVMLTPGKGDGDKKQWTLRVTIPAGKLYGNLFDSYVVLKTKEAQSRRVRIPVKATTFDAGSR